MVVRKSNRETVTEINFETEYWGLTILVNVRRILGIDHKITYAGHYLRPHLSSVKVILNNSESEEIFNKAYVQKFMNKQS